VLSGMTTGDGCNTQQRPHTSVIPAPELESIVYLAAGMILVSILFFPEKMNRISLRHYNQ